jgi:membrane-bound metal-dependent hydrolase YbcI (DUF457 family)
MFVGHLAAALGAARVERRVPLAAAVAATFALDLLWPMFLLAGVERVRIDPGNTAFTPLAFDHYPWSHSLAMAIAWGAVAAVAARRLGARAAGVVCALVVSHWVLDLVTHRPDLPLWPGESPMMGLGLWHSIGGTLIVEGAMLAAGAIVYARGTRPRDGVGRWAFWTGLLVLAAIWAAQPWSAPPPSVRAIAVVGLAGGGLLPLWAAWVARHRADPVRGMEVEGPPGGGYQ